MDKRLIELNIMNEVFLKYEELTDLMLRQTKDDEVDGILLNLSKREKALNEIKKIRKSVLFDDELNNSYSLRMKKIQESEEIVREYLLRKRKEVRMSLKRQKQMKKGLNGYKQVAYKSSVNYRK